MTKEYRLRITSQNPVIISQAQFDACKNKDGSLKFGTVNEVVSFGSVGVNLKDVRGWEQIKLDPMPRGYEEGQTKLNTEGIRKLRLVHAAINTRKLDLLGLDERGEVAGIVRDWQARKASGDYAKRKYFDKLHYDVWYKDDEAREAAYKHWSKSAEALEVNAQELQQTAEELFAPLPEPVPAEMSSGEKVVQEVKEIMKQKLDDEEWISPF